MTPVTLRPATPADSEFCYQLHKAAMGGYVTAIWGWDEQAQRGFHDRAFNPARWQIITAGGTDIGMLDVEQGLDHSFMKHAKEWFGRTVNRSTRWAEWRSLVERAAQSRKIVPWFASNEPTWLHLARIEGKWFAVQFSRSTGELVTAFIPNPDQLGAILRLLGK